MQLTNFRVIKSDLPPVYSICSTNKYIIMHLSKSIVSFYSLQNFAHIFTFDIGYSITSIEKFSDDFLVVGTEECKCIILNLHDFRMLSIDIDAKLVSLKNEDKLYGLDAENRIYCINVWCDAEHEIKADLEICCRPLKKISTWCEIGGNIVTIDISGYCKIFVEKEMKKEFFIKNERFNEIKQIEENIFALVTQTGYLIVVDIDKECILCEVKIRNSPLFAIGVIKDQIFCAGEDNRIICYRFNDNRLYRKNQTDSHKSTVRCIFINHERIITLSDDCTLSIHTVLDQGYSFRSVIPQYNLLKTIENKVIVNNINEISIYEISENDKGNSLMQLGYFTNEYRHLASIISKEKILNFDVSENKKYLGYSTKLETVIYNIDGCYSKILTFESSFDVKFYKNFFCFSTFKKMLLIYNFDTCTICFEMLLEDYPEKMIILTDYILLKQRNVLIDTAFTQHKLNLDFEIEHATQEGTKIYMIGYTTTFKITTSYFIGCYDTNSKIFSKLTDIKQVLRLDNMVFFNNTIICNDIENLVFFILETGLIKRHHTDRFIVGMNKLKKSLIIGQKLAIDVIRDGETNKNIKIKWKKKLKNK